MCIFMYVKLHDIIIIILKVNTIKICMTKQKTGFLEKKNNKGM